MSIGEQEKRTRNVAVALDVEVCRALAFGWRAYSELGGESELLSPVSDSGLESISDSSILGLSPRRSRSIYGTSLNAPTACLNTGPSSCLSTYDPPLVCLNTSKGPRYLGLCFRFISFSICVFLISTNSPVLYISFFRNRRLNFLSNSRLDLNLASLRTLAALAMSSGLFSNCRMRRASKSSGFIPDLNPVTINVDSVKSKGNSG